MRQHNKNNNRSRGRGGRKGPNPLTRSYESNGPDVKVRGTAQHVAEKYQTLARDALSAGDGISAEAYFQHAEHYNRIIMTAQTQQNAAREEQNAAREEERRNAAQAQENKEQSNKDVQPAVKGETQTAVADQAGNDTSDENTRDKEQSKPRRGRGHNRQSRRSEGKADAAAASDETNPSVKEQPDPFKEKPDTILDNPPAFLVSD